MDRRLEGDWWTNEVVKRITRLEDAGALVEKGYFELREFLSGRPLIWSNFERERKSGKEEFDNEVGCGSCCAM